MTSKQQTKNDKPAKTDFPKTTWVDGANAKFASAGIAERKHNDGIQFYVRGYNKILEKCATVSAHFDHKGGLELYNALGKQLGLPAVA